MASGGLLFFPDDCQRGEEAWYGVLESGLDIGADLVLLQEQPLFEGYRHRGYHLHSVKGGRAMTAVRIDTKFKYEVRDDLITNTEGDIVILDLYLPQRLRVVNVYNQKLFRDGRQINVKPAQLARWDEILTGPCIVAGDINAHSPRWGSTHSRDHTFWEDLMDGHGLKYSGNGQPTRGDSTIDLVLASTDLI